MKGGGAQGRCRVVFGVLAALHFLFVAAIVLVPQGVLGALQQESWLLTREVGPFLPGARLADVHPAAALWLAPALGYALFFAGCSIRVLRNPRERTSLTLALGGVAGIVGLAILRLDPVVVWGDAMGFPGAARSGLVYGVASVFGLIAVAALAVWLDFWTSVEPGVATDARDTQSLQAVLETWIPAGGPFPLGATDARILTAVADQLACGTRFGATRLRLLLRWLDCSALLAHRMRFSSLTAVAREELLDHADVARPWFERIVGRLLEPHALLAALREQLLLEFYRDPRVLESIGYDAAHVMRRMRLGPNRERHLDVTSQCPEESVGPPVAEDPSVLTAPPVRSVNPSDAWTTGIDQRPTGIDLRTTSLEHRSAGKAEERATGTPALRLVRPGGGPTSL